MRVRLLLFVASLLAVMALTTRVAMAGAFDLTNGGNVQLSTLLADPNVDPALGTFVIVGDKEFYNFRKYSSEKFDVTDPQNPTPLPAANPALISVVGLPGLSEEGIRFQSIQNQWKVSANQAMDTSFIYSVISTVGQLMDDITLTTGGAATYNGGWVVDETVSSSAFAENFAMTNPPPGPDDVISSVHKVFPTPVPSVDVLKDISLDGGNIVGTSFASITFVDQTFSQVPLPAAAWAGLVLLGGLGLNKVRRNRA